MNRICASLIALLLLGSNAIAQSVQQSGTITPGHPARWISNGVVGDAGTAASGSLTGLGVTAQGPGICQNSAPITGPYNRLCLSVSTAADAVISLQNFGGAAAQSLKFTVNGISYTLPSAFGLTVGTTTISGGTNGGPLYNASGLLENGTRTGNTTAFATANGTLTNGHCVSIDSNGNFVDAGGTCTTGGGGGTVTSATANQLAYYLNTGSTVVGLATANNGVLGTDGSGVPSITTTPKATSLALNGCTIGSDNLCVSGISSLAGNLKLTSLANGIYINGNRFIGTTAAIADPTIGTDTWVGNGVGVTHTTGGENAGFGFTTLSNVTTGVANVGMGGGSLTAATSGSRNVGVGRHTMRFLTTGSDNVAIGEFAMGGGLAIGQTAANNVAIGSSAGENIDSGTLNTAVGSGALRNGGTASNNIGIGNSATAGNASGITGANNIGIGTSALAALTSGAGNFGAGASSLGVLTTGTNNVSIGTLSLPGLISGSTNTVAGANAGYTLTTGSGNTFVGGGAFSAGAGAGVTTGSNNTVIGACNGLAATLASNIILCDGSGNPRAQYNAGWGFSDAGTSPALTSCGSSPTISGSDFAGTVTMGTGSPTGCVITFAAVKGAAPHCAVTWRATPLASQSYTTSTTAITLTQTATSSNLIDYICVGL